MRRDLDSSTQTPLRLTPWLLASMIVLAALSRLLPHPPNFSPVEAMALFAGAWFDNRRWALAVPLLAMLLSDLVLATLHGGLYAAYFASFGFWLVYLALLACTGLGFALRAKVTAPRVLGFSLLGALLFFLITNAGAWFADAASATPLYARGIEGLLAAYVAGIPFFQYSVAGVLFYAAVLFGGFALLRRYVPALRMQTA